MIRVAAHLWELWKREGVQVWTEYATAPQRAHKVTNTFWVLHPNTKMWHLESANGFAQFPHSYLATKLLSFIITSAGRLKWKRRFGGVCCLCQLGTCRYPTCWAHTLSLTVLNLIYICASKLRRALHPFFFSCGPERWIWCVSQATDWSKQGKPIPYSRRHMVEVNSLNDCMRSETWPHATRLIWLHSADQWDFQCLFNTFIRVIKAKALQVCKITQNQFASTVTHLVFVRVHLFIHYTPYEEVIKQRRCPKGGQMSVWLKTRAGKQTRRGRTGPKTRWPPHQAQWPQYYQTSTVVHGKSHTSVNLFK